MTDLFTTITLEVDNNERLLNDVLRYTHHCVPSIRQMSKLLPNSVQQLAGFLAARLTSITSESISEDWVHVANHYIIKANEHHNCEVDTILDEYDLGMMTDNFVYTLLWSNHVQQYYSAHDIANDDYDRLHRECRAFLYLAIRDKLLTDDELSDISDIAHDFCLTRNHEGAGFWDGDYECGEALTRLAQRFTPVTAERNPDNDEDAYIYFG
jgi:hypothetical protein